jgi:hypothetical protein
MTNTNIILKDTELALEAANALLPEILGVVASFYPPAKYLSAFLPLIRFAIQGVDTVAQATGQTTVAATAAVIDHLTPGAPNAPALSVDATQAHSA